MGWDYAKGAVGMLIVVGLWALVDAWWRAQPGRSLTSGCAGCGSCERQCRKEK